MDWGPYTTSSPTAREIYSKPPPSMWSLHVSFPALGSVFGRAAPHGDSPVTKPPPRQHGKIKVRNFPGHFGLSAGSPERHKLLAGVLDQAHVNFFALFRGPPRRTGARHMTGSPPAVPEADCSYRDHFPNAHFDLCETIGLYVWRELKHHCGVGRTRRCGVTHLFTNPREKPI